MPKRLPWSHTLSAHPLTSASTASGRAFVAKSNSRPPARVRPEEGVAHRAADQEALVAGVDEPRARPVARATSGSSSGCRRFGTVVIGAILAPGWRTRRNPFRVPFRAPCVHHAERSLRYRRRDADAVLACRVWRPRGGVLLFRRPRRARCGSTRSSPTAAWAPECSAPVTPTRSRRRGAGTSRTAAPGPRASGSTGRRSPTPRSRPPDGRGTAADPRTRRGPGARPGAAHRSAAVPDRGRRQRGAGRAALPRDRRPVEPRRAPRRALTLAGARLRRRRLRVGAPPREQ